MNCSKSSPLPSTPGRPTRAGVQRKLRDLHALERQLARAAAWSERSGNVASASGYRRQCRAVRAERAEWERIECGGDHKSRYGLPLRSLSARASEKPAALAAVLALCVALHLAQSLATPVHAARLPHPALIATLAVYSAVVALAPYRQSTPFPHDAADAPRPRHWAAAVASAELDRKAAASPHLQYALRTKLR